MVLVLSTISAPLDSFLEGGSSRLYRRWVGVCSTACPPFALSLCAQLMHLQLGFTPSLSSVRIMGNRSMTFPIGSTTPSWGRSLESVLDQGALWVWLSCVRVSTESFSWGYMLIHIEVLSVKASHILWSSQFVSQQSIHYHVQKDTHRNPLALCPQQQQETNTSINPHLLLSSLIDRWFWRQTHRCWTTQVGSSSPPRMPVQPSSSSSSPSTWLSRSPTTSSTTTTWWL